MSKRINRTKDNRMEMKAGIIRYLKSELKGTVMKGLFGVLLVFLFSIFIFAPMTQEAEAAPTFVDKGTFTSGTGALSVPPPASYQDNDVFLLFVESANEAIATPTGWTQVANSPQFTGTAAAAGGVRLAVFYKIVSGAQSDVSVADSGNHTTAIIAGFRGVDTATPIHITAGSVDAVATSAISTPSVTTTITDTMIVNAIGLDKDGNDTDTITTVPVNANLTNLTERHDQTVNSGAGGGIAFFTGEKATAGAVGNTTATADTSTTHAYITIALKPVPPTPPSVVSGPTASSTEYGSYVDSPFHLNAVFNDNGSAISSCGYSLNNGDSWTSGTVSGSGANTNCDADPTCTDGQSLTILMRATNTGGTTNTSSILRTCDAAAPTTSDNQTSSNWQATEKTVTLTPDDSTGSGVTNATGIYGCFGTSCTPSVLGSNSMTTNCGSGNACTYDVRYYSVDNVGNTESTKTSSYQARVDRAAPAAPTGFSAADAGTGGQCNMSWNGDASDTGSGLNTTAAFKVYWATGSAPACGAGTLGCTQGSSSTSCNITGLENGALHYFRLCVYDNVNTETSDGTATCTPTAPADTITIGQGVDPTAAPTLCPGTTGTYLDAFSLQVTAGANTTITSVDVTTAGTAGTGSIAKVYMTDSYGTPISGAEDTSPVGDVWTLPLSPSLSVTSTLTNYRIYVDLKAYASATAGTITGNVSGLGTSYTIVDNDTASDTITVDKTAPADATWGSNTAGDGEVTLNWTKANAGDSVLIYMNTVTTDNTAPTGGTPYAVNDSIGTNTVKYVGTGTTTTITGLTNGTTYYFKIFEYDSCANYAGGVWSSGLTPSVAVPTTTTVTDGTDPSNESICAGDINQTIDGFDLNETTGNGNSTVSAVEIRFYDYTDVTTVYVKCGVTTHGSGTPTGNIYNLSLTTNITVPSGGTNSCNLVVNTDSGASGILTAYISNITVTGDKGTISDSSATFIFDISEPDLITDFAATSGQDSQVPLSWTNPVDSGLAEVVVMRKTGSYPTNHTDGTQVYQNTSPTSGGSVNTTDTAGPPANGTTYYYAVFSKDNCGNWNDTVTAQNSGTATPAACTRTNPTVSLGSNQTISLSGSAVYIVSITNNDTSNCANTTFNLSILSETGNTGSFSLPSTGLPCSVTNLSPGATNNTTCTLTVTGNGTGSDGQSLVTTVRTSSASHANVDKAVTTTLFTTAILHNSTNLGNASYGAWGVSGGKYGEFVCETCHTDNTTNIKRIRTQIETPNIDTWPSGGQLTNTIIFTQADGTNSNMGDTSATGGWTGICNVCHDAANHTKYWYAGSDSHEANKDCTQCHPHSAGFAPTDGECVTCHNVARSDVYNTRQIVGAGGDFVRLSRHVSDGTSTEIVTNYDCAVCHAEGDVTKINAGTGWTSATLHNDGSTSTTRMVNLRNVDDYAGATFNFNKNAVTDAMRTNMDTFCLNCHDVDGASTINVNATNNGLNLNNTRALTPFNTNDTLRNGRDGFTTRTRVVDVKSQFYAGTGGSGTGYNGNPSQHAVLGARYSTNDSNWTPATWTSHTLRNGDTMNVVRERARLHCSDCHLSETNAHGAVNAWHMLLNGTPNDYTTDYDMGGVLPSTNASVVCYKCHSPTYYGNTSQTSGTRWNHYNKEKEAYDQGNYGGSPGKGAELGPYCLLCHAGDGFGRIHGRGSPTDSDGDGTYAGSTYTPVGGTGTYTKQRFMPGAWMQWKPGTTEDDTAWNSATGTAQTCYFPSSSSWSACTQHSNGNKTGSTANYARPTRY
jgi:hypothetical protein